jgi:hypothetical protein
MLLSEDENDSLDFDDNNFLENVPESAEVLNDDRVLLDYFDASIASDSEEDVDFAQEPQEDDVMEEDNETATTETVEQPAPVDTGDHAQVITDEDRLHFGNATEWMNPKQLTHGKLKKTFGHVSTLFKRFDKRRDAFSAGVHCQIQAGIDGSTGLPAASVVAQSLGGYHDEDNGNVLIYTGQGGDEKTDQTLTKYNACLVLNHERKVPVRVLRGYQLDSKYAPSAGYRYDGLYWVTKYWSDKHPTGTANVYKFRLVRLENQGAIPEVANFKAKSVKRISRTQYATGKDKKKDKKEPKKLKNTEPLGDRRSRVTKPSKMTAPPTRTKKVVAAASQKATTTEKMFLANTGHTSIPETVITVNDENNFVANTPVLNQRGEISFDRRKNIRMEREEEAAFPLINTMHWQPTYTNIPIVMRTPAVSVESIAIRCQRSDMPPIQVQPNTLSFAHLPLLVQQVNPAVLLSMIDENAHPQQSVEQYMKQFFQAEQARRLQLEALLGDQYVPTMLERSLDNQVRIRTGITALCDMLDGL